jgi:hypothetical protein
MQFAGAFGCSHGLVTGPPGIVGIIPDPPVPLLPELAPPFPFPFPLPPLPSA